MISIFNGVLNIDNNKLYEVLNPYIHEIRIEHKDDNGKVLAYISAELLTARNEDIVLLKGFKTLSKHCYKKYESELAEVANTQLKGLLKDVFSDFGFGKHYLKLDSVVEGQIPLLVEIRSDEDGVPLPSVQTRQLTLYEKDGVFFEKEFGVKSGNPGDTLEILKRRLMKEDVATVSLNGTPLPVIFYVCNGCYYKSCGVSLK